MRALLGVLIGLLLLIAAAPARGQATPPAAPHPVAEGPYAVR